LFIVERGRARLRPAGDLDNRDGDLRLRLGHPGGFAIVIDIYAFESSHCQIKEGLGRLGRVVEYVRFGLVLMLGLWIVLIGFERGSRRTRDLLRQNLRLDGDTGGRSEGRLGRDDLGDRYEGRQIRQMGELAGDFAHCGTLDGVLAPRVTEGEIANSREGAAAGKRSAAEAGCAEFVGEGIDRGEKLDHIGRIRVTFSDR